MRLFTSDYTEGAHPLILEKLQETNFEQTTGYGIDPHCERARMLIREACKAPDADVHFLVGGTQTNATVITSILRPYQGVICASTGHINAHETGAIEHGGHKCIALPSSDGTITAAQIEEAYREHWADESHEHVVQPGMVYISFPTELGTIYKKSELEAISRVCHDCGLPLFLDGARLGYGLVAAESLWGDCGENVTLADLARLCDVFYIGGTKQGALFGEAVVITNPALKKDFRYNIKQGGGMLAKGRLLGIQFETLFSQEGEDSLYISMSRHAVRLAGKLRSALKDKGYPFKVDSPTNQIFPVLDKGTIVRLSENFGFESWGTVDKEHTAVRFCTSWATREEAVDELISEL